MFQKSVYILLPLFWILGLGNAHGATVLVTTNLDEFDNVPNEKCSLREAIQSFNDGSGFGGCDIDETVNPLGTDDTITFENPNQEFNLTIDPSGFPDDNQNGDLDICSIIAIQGGGMDQTIIRAAFSDNSPDRVIHILSDPSNCDDNAVTDTLNGQGFDPTLMLSDVTVENGNATPILSTGQFVIGGGGILNEGVLVLSDSNVQDNTASDVPFAGQFEVRGGGIFTLGNNDTAASSIFGCNIRNNEAIATKNDDETNNLAFGGGLAGAVNLGGGGLIEGQGKDECILALEDTDLHNNNATTGAGGGISSENCFLGILRSAIFSNTVTGDTPTDPGNTRLGNGGGIYMRGDSGNENIFFALSDSTVSMNETTGNGGGIYDQNQELGPTQISSSTIVLNTANGSDTGGGGGIFHEGDSNSQDRLQVQNTILADNLAPFGAGSDCLTPDPTDPLTSFGFNLIKDSTDCTIVGPGGGARPPTDQPEGTDPNLGPLADNGGITLTHAVLFGSPAIDGGNDLIGCTDLVTGTPTVLDFDQRNAPFLRTVAGVVGGTPRCDIGAYEFQPTALSGQKDVNAQFVSVGDLFTYTVTFTNDGPGTATGAQLVDMLSALVTFVSFGNISEGTCNHAAGTVTCDLGTLGPGASVTVEIIVQALAEGTALNDAVLSANETDPADPFITNQVSTEIVGGCITGSGNPFDTIRAGCGNCSFHPQAVSFGGLQDYLLLLGLALMLLCLLTWRVKRQG